MARQTLENAGRTMIPVARRFRWRPDGDDPLIVLDPRECLGIPDRDGRIEQFSDGALRPPTAEEVSL